MKEVIKKKVVLTESFLEGSTPEAESLINREKRSGNLIISFNYGRKVGMKFERSEKAIEKAIDNLSNNPIDNPSS